MLTRRRVPLFVSQRNGEAGPGAWWQRREMVVALIHADCPPCAGLRARLAARTDSLAARGTGGIALEVDGRDAELARDVVRSLELDPRAACAVVADRYGEAFAAVPVHGASADEVLDEVEAWVEHIQQQCPE
jgi:hypothetical protein